LEVRGEVQPQWYDPKLAPWSDAHLIRQLRELLWRNDANSVGAPREQAFDREEYRAHGRGEVLAQAVTVKRVDYDWDTS
jgi:hypothetical protein